MYPATSITSGFADTSLTIVAPAATASSATSAWRVSMLTRTAGASALTTGRGGDRVRSRLLHAPDGHAHVLRLDDDEHALRLEDPHERVRHLRREPLLHLRSPGVALHDPCHLRQPGDAAVLPGDVGDV